MLIETILFITHSICLENHFVYDTLLFQGLYWQYMDQSILNVSEKLPVNHIHLT